MSEVRKATVNDVPQIYELLKAWAERGLLLPRSLSDLYDVVRDFFVVSAENEPDIVAGICALHVCWEDLGEIRSMAVVQNYQGTGLGRRLLEACLAEARELGLNRLFVLTYIPEYFARYGFALIEKSSLPQKIWADCFKCVKFPECEEVAMKKEL